MEYGGNSVSYNYDTKVGKLNNQTDTNRTITSYSYDNIDRLSKVSKIVDGNTIDNVYSYDGDKISQITHNGFNYNFKYDSLGNNTEVSVGSQNLITNIFESRSSKLLKSVYGNGQSVSSIYDGSNNVVGNYYNNDNNHTISYSGNIQSTGVKTVSGNDSVLGSVGQGLRLESLAVSLANVPSGMRIKYQAQVEGSGWQNWVYDGATAGTIGQSKRMEAVRIQLEGAPEEYSVRYQVHVQSLGWMDPVEDGEIAGTVGEGLRIEAIKISVIKKRNSYTYDASGNLAVKKDYVNGIEYKYIYDAANRLVNIQSSDGNKVTYGYDKNNNTNSVTEKINGTDYKTSYGYDKDDRLNKTTLNNGISILQNYDSISRLRGELIANGKKSYNVIYKYRDGINGSTTTNIESINNNGSILEYDYDRNGNIEKITEDSDSLIAYYSFDNNSIKDESGNGNDGKTYGNPTYVTGKKGKAIQFDGVDDWAELADFDAGETYSISMWVNPSTTKGGQSFIAKHTESGDNILLIGLSDDGYHVSLRNQLNIQGSKTTGYQHIVITVKKISDTQSLVKVYKDKALLWEKTLNSTTGNTKGKPWVLAQEWDGTAISDIFKGAIDEVAIFGKELSTTEVSNIYTNGINVALNDKQTKYYYNELNELVKEETKDSDGIIAYYSFDNNSIIDDSKNGNDGKTYGNPTYDTGKRGKAIQFDGVDDWAELADFDAGETYSISMWVNPSTTNGGQSFIAKHTEGGDNILLVGLSEAGYHVSIRNNLNIQGSKTTGYQHIVVTVKKVSGNESLVRVYKNKSLLWEKTLSGTMGNTKGKPWVLAQEWDGTDISDMFKGAIDEVSIHDHVLTTSEINGIYTNGIKVSPKTSIEYSYDKGGNILSKKEYDTSGKVVSTVNYSYEDSNWKDKLTSYNGKAITYDAIGNLLTYDGYMFTWEMGRQLKSLSGNGKTISYKYNDSGIRTEKTVNGITTKYILNGDNVIYEDNGTDKIHYSYGGNGLVSLNLNGTEYYYEKNIQGDIIGLIDSYGNRIVKYTYNGWGKLESITGELSESVGKKNPYRYRGYRYDTETALYYLNSRYYNPEWCRMLNADTVGIVTTSLGDLTDKNLFAYCDNNPIVRRDSSGYVWETVFDIASLVVSVGEVVVNPADPWAWAGVVGDTIDLIPFVTGVGEVTRGVKATVRIQKAMDLSDEAIDIAKTLDRSSGFTKSTMKAGREIHKGYKKGLIGKEFADIKGIRPDYVDFNTRTIYELKPYNLKSIKTGIKQLNKYNKALGGNFKMVLEVY